MIGRHTASGHGPSTASSSGHHQHFPPAARLLDAEQYKRVFKRNRRSADRHFTILARSNDQGVARLGLAIAVKACGNAVQRNRVKRVVRESFRRARDTLPAVDLVVMVRPGVRATDSAALRTSLKQHWKEIEQRCAR